MWAVEMSALSVNIMELDGSKKNTFEKLNNIVSFQKQLLEIIQTFRKEENPRHPSGKKVKKLLFARLFHAEILKLRHKRASSPWRKARYVHSSLVLRISALKSDLNSGCFTGECLGFFSSVPSQTAPSSHFVWLSWALWLSLWRTHRPRCEHFHVGTIYFPLNNTRHPYRRIKRGKRASGHGWETRTCDGEGCKHWRRRGEGSACFLLDKRSANLCAVILKEKRFPTWTGCQQGLWMTSRQPAVSPKLSKTI